MTTVLETGPASVRVLSSHTAPAVAYAVPAAAALDGIDDAFVLVDEQPIEVTTLWRSIIDAVVDKDSDSAVLIHPSWWSPSRVARVTEAARTAMPDVVARPRTWLLRRAAAADTPIVVEIAARLVVVSAELDDRVVAAPRTDEPRRVVDAVVRVVVQMGPAATVVIDAPEGVGGASVVAAMVAERLHGRGNDRTVVIVDDGLLRRLAGEVEAQDTAAVARVDQTRPASRRTIGVPVVVAALVVVVALIFALALRGREAPPGSAQVPLTYLVEGRVALEIPQQWTVERVTAGPGSARVQVTSPQDPDAVLHVTQSRVPGETLTRTADALRRALDEQPGDVFVDFNPADQRAGRPAVTYREVRPGRDVRWTVMLDGSVRISIGCQSAPGRQDSIRDACEHALATARAVS
jgi:type VII secretion-associated protein (TIGR03931 family)